MEIVLPAMEKVWPCYASQNFKIHLTKASRTSGRPCGNHLTPSKCITTTPAAIGNRRRKI